VTRRRAGDDGSVLDFRSRWGRPTHVTIAESLRALSVADSSAPLVTFYDLGSGARAELSRATFDNAVAKAANLLTTDLDAQPGDTITLALPLHWQTAVWIVACASVGAVASMCPDGALGSPSDTAAIVGPASVAVIEAGGSPITETFAVSLHSLGMPFAAPLPAGVLDAAVEVRAHGDRFAGAHISGHTPAVFVAGVSYSHDEISALATDFAREIGLAEGQRLLTRLEPSSLRGFLALLPGAVARGGSVVMIAGEGDTATIGRQELVDVWLTS